MFTNILNFIQESNLPAWVFIAVPSAVILLGLYLFYFVHTRIFKYRLRRIINAQDSLQAEEALKKFVYRYSPEKLVRYSKRMERYSRQMGPRVVRETGLADKWVQKLSSTLPTATDLRRVLLYCHPSSLFKAYLAVESHPRLGKPFQAWMTNEGEEKVIRQLADTCRGEEFEPVFGKMFVENHNALLRELTGESEWFARYFAYRLLLLDKDSLVERSLEVGLTDSHPLIRKILTESFEGDREKIWAILWDKMIHDPVFEVRETARKRIGREFIDLYDLKDKPLNAEETFRVLELLDPDFQEDRTFAMSILQTENKELRYPAAAFLEKCGVLAAMLAKNTLDDPGNIEHSVRLLQEALEVNVSGFLKDYPTGDGGPLLVVARLLIGHGGTHENITHLEKKVFTFFLGKKLDPSIIEIYTKTLDAILTKGNVRSFELLAEELARRETEKQYLELILPRIPVKVESLFVPILFRFLKNPAFPAQEELIQILGNFSADVILPEAFRVLNGSRTEYPHGIRINALKVLGHMHKPFCLQRILESLPTLRPEELEEFANIFANYPKEMFEEKTKTLLASPDSKIRASLITILPITKNETFIKEVRASLKDVDPDVRVAAIKALLGFGEIKLLNQETSMLRDPVERVRLTTAEVIARHGNADALEILKAITVDPNETDVVKIGVITGLGQAVNAEGIPILIDVLDLLDDFRQYAEKALAMRVAKKDMIKLIEIFKDAEPQLREKLIPVFKEQGRKAEPMILEVLKDEVASLKPYLVRILEETGYVDEAKKRLSNRNIEIRREAALMLSLLDTLPAFRGLVMAAKDPDQEVRVCVVKALEKLKSDHGREILEKLKEDPDNRIRKYTHWALERLESLAME